MRAYKGYIIDQPDFKLLDKNFITVLGHLYEEVYSYNIITKEKVGIWRFQYEPTCGIIGKNNDWCLIGGEVLILRTYFDRTVRQIGDLQNIHDLRLVNEYTAQILTDPWSEDAAIWQLEIDPKRTAPAIGLWKIKDFKDYLDQPYVENVTW